MKCEKRVSKEMEMARDTYVHHVVEGDDSLGIGLWYWGVGGTGHLSTFVTERGLLERFDQGVECVLYFGIVGGISYL